jgi:pimeloyl-ACP methyl ester carboxylesterase
MIAYRIAAWYPEMVTRLFTFCVPSHLNKQWIDLEAHVNPTPNFAYMQQCVGGVIEEKTQDREGIKQYLNALYGGYLPTGERAMSLAGVNFEIASQLLRSPLVSEEELDFYVDQYSRNGLRGPRKCSIHPLPELKTAEADTHPVSYYHNMQQNVVDEQALLHTSGGQMAVIKCPTLYVFAVNDGIITREMAEQMKDYIPDLTFKEVAASHWVLWEKPAEANAILQDWLLAPNHQSQMSWPSRALWKQKIRAFLHRCVRRAYPRTR